jgi:hypothetical protein
MTNFDPPTDPYGDERHCPTCDACMVQSSAGDWECLQYHDDELVSQKDYVKKGTCPVCRSNRIDVDEADLADVPVQVKVSCNCLACKAIWKEVYQFSEYKMVGTK